MPTGYTVFIEDGEITNAKDFLMLCARAFGVAIDMREEPLSKPMPKEFKPSTYHLERLEEERRELDRLRSMTMDEVHNQNEAEYQRDVAACKEMLEKKKAIKIAMLRYSMRLRRGRRLRQSTMALKNLPLNRSKYVYRIFRFMTESL